MTVSRYVNDSDVNFFSVGWLVSKWVLRVVKGVIVRICIYLDDGRCKWGSVPWCNNWNL